ncbi:hydroxymethylglutaryl-CoA lyase [Pseudonocardia thermophila]|uniref:Hydroxymethylglutaryl-CoA lyase n=1 Tax=Pseudonocardia thermophila TaxID=1848 RepID=A0A1M6XJY6_PSETH|nr:hydroxymethylglutaryl-CoA lyase [Pseudonocardia thermophila]SHL06169.1 hydroxymethylglutaryl-CoA lyase [Pseudonocardia thermophila]
MSAPTVEIVEVALRDGLQNEPVVLPTADKLRLLDGLLAAGARRLEIASFVHPRLVPAMADAEAVLAGARRLPGVTYAGLVLNRRGLERALAAGVDEIDVVVCASDTFSRRNQNAGTEESMAEALEIVADARAAGLAATVTIATAFGCPFEGEIDPARVLGLARRALDAGAGEIAFADTIGCGVPDQVAHLASAVREWGNPAGLRFHFHNTRNTGYANAWAAVEHGATALDASVGGIGGCPFAPRATGNVATEDLAYLLARSGLATGLDLDALCALSGTVGELLGKQVPALLPRAGTFPPSRVDVP